MSPRFFLSVPVSADSVCPFVVELEGTEQHHLAHVLRASSGTRVTLFDGSGEEFDGIVVDVERKVARIEIQNRLRINRELNGEVVLGVALPKGDRQQVLVEKMVEMGVTTLVPLQTERGIALTKDQSTERMLRWSIAAAKQCGRNRLLKIAQPESISTFAARSQSHPVLVAHPYEPAVPLVNVLGKLPGTTVAIGIAIGPEGGFSPTEIASIQGGPRVVSLGKRILRVETAAQTLVANVTYALNY